MQTKLKMLEEMTEKQKSRVKFDHPSELRQLSKATHTQKLLKIKSVLQNRLKSIIRRDVISFGLSTGHIGIVILIAWV